MKRVQSFVLCLLFAAFFSSCESLLPSDTAPVDTSGISIKEVDVFVEYTSAKVYGDISVSTNPERITGIRVYYGDTSSDLKKSVTAAYDTQNGFSADLTSLEDGKQFFYRVDIMVGKTPVEGTISDFVTFPQGPVELDLPSGKKWASHNVGAKNPTERGDHFAWGETTKKEQYSWSTYKYCLDGDYLHKLTKYVDNTYSSASGMPDNLVTLQRTDDAAIANMGKEWRTPTRQEWQELIDYGVIKHVKINNIQGVIVSSKKNMNDSKKFIFIPEYPGKYTGTQFYELGSAYWTATLSDGASVNEYARVITMTTGDSFIVNLHSQRCEGLSIRAIYDGN